MIRRESFRSMVFGLGAAVVGATANGAEPFESLVSQSPFGQPAPVAAVATAGEGTALEFRGVFADQGEYFFSLYEISSRTGRWVGMQETGEAMVVENYDSEKGRIEVRYRGQLMKLTLKKAQVVLQASTAPRPPTPAAGPAVAVAVPTNPAPLTETEQLGQVADEIRQRRAARRSASASSRPEPADPRPAIAADKR